MRAYKPSLSMHKANTIFPMTLFSKKKIDKRALHLKHEKHMLSSRVGSLYIFKKTFD